MTRRVSGTGSAHHTPTSQNSRKFQARRKSRPDRRRRRQLFLETLEDRRVLAAGFFQGFEADAVGWDVFGGSFDASRVASGTNGITSRTGAFHGQLSAGNGAATPFGPSTAVGYTDTFPVGGYTTSVDVYLDLSGGWANDTRFDWDSAISMPDGNHRRDFIFNAGFYDVADLTGPGAGLDRFVVSASNNSSPGSAFPKNPAKDPIAITSSGWHTFQHTFYDSGGVLAVDMTILDATGSPVKTWTLSDPTDIIGSTVGGNRYGWFTDQDFSVLAFDNSLQSTPDTVYVDDDWSALPAGSDPDGPGPANLLGFDAFATIQEGVDAVGDGGTVNVLAGDYHEDVDVSKPLTLQGAGIDQTNVFGVSGGSHATFDFNANGIVLDGFTITRDGNNPGDWDNNLNTAGVALQSLGNAEVRNSRFYGNRTAIDINNSDGNWIHNNVIDDNRTGIILRNENLNNVIEENSIADNWTVGVLWLDSTSTDNAVGTVVRNNDISGNWYAQVENRAVVTGGEPNSVKNFSGNWLGTNAPTTDATNGTEPGYSALIPVAYGGTAMPPAGPLPTIRGAGLADIDFTPFLDSGMDTEPGTPGFQGDFSTLHVTSLGEQTGATGRIQEGIDLVTNSTVQVRSGSYTGNVDATSKPIALAPGASPGQVTVNGDFTLDANDTLDVEIDGFAADYDQWTVTGTTTLGGSDLDVSLLSLPAVGDELTIIDGSSAIVGEFAGKADGSTFAVGPVTFEIDYQGGVDGFDVVLTVTDVTLLVQSTGFTLDTPTDTDNDYTRVNDAVQAAPAGATVQLEGTFDWTEVFAAADWELGSDGLTSTDDDYSLMIPSGRANVTITAAALGDARIQGPGDLTTVNLESAFLSEFSGGSAAYTGLEISNLEIFDFDLSIGLFFGGPANKFDDVQLLNNHIRIATDVIDDANQNIGIHLATGQNQTIQGNVIDIPGDGLSDTGGSMFAASVGLQSNTHGGTSYDGLLIDGNTINILNAQSADPEVIYGIWENGHAHDSDITVSNNTFQNLDAGNDPAVNQQRAFRITSHSSATTTVAYSGNTVAGASVGFRWLVGQNFAGRDPVVLTANTVTDTQTGFLIRSNGSATLTGNVITGGDTGILVESGSAAGTVVFNNSISGATTAIENQDAATLDASGNWWGGTGEATIAGLLSGPVDFTPFLDSGTDTDGGTTGFQGDFSVLNVTSMGAQSGSTGRIQEGIDLVTNSTVNVYPGTYDESPTINKSLTLQSTGGRDVTTINLTHPAGFPYGALHVQGQDVTVDGFTIVGGDAVGAGLATTNILLDPGLNDVNILNNRLRVGDAGTGSNGDDGIGLLTTYTTTPANFVQSLEVSGNIFEPVNSAGQRAFFINAGVAEFQFLNNEIIGAFDGSALTQATDGLVEGNTVTGSGLPGSRSAGIGVWGFPDPTVYGHTTFRSNTISGTSRGLSLFDVESVIVENNVISDVGVGILFDDSFVDADIATIQVTNNSISSVDTYLIENDDVSAGTFNASANWWGSADETAIASLMDGPVDFTPFLDSGADTDVGTAGFQGDFSTLHVTSLGEQTGATGRIQEAVDLVTNSTVIVHDGTYVENVLIDKNVALISENGRATTTIEGVSGIGALGTVQVANVGTTAVEIGRTGQGFTVVGIDNGAPGIENAAVYFQGGHSGAMIVDNEIQANGDHGLLTEFGATISGFVVDGNEFSGQTFVGAQPGGIGFTGQFTLPNFPRQLVVFGNGGGNVATASATNITFTNNLLSGTAGGISSDDNVSEQGNTLATLDAANSTITGNTFAGTTRLFGAALRVRRPDTLISGNVFDSSNMGLGTEQMFLQNNTTPIESVVPVNTLDRGTYVHGGSDLSVSITGGADRATGGDTLHILPGTYTENVDVSTTGANKNLTLAPGTSPGQVTVNGDFTLDGDDTLEMEVNGIATPGTDHDQFVVNGAVDLGGAALATSGTVSGLTAGDTVVLIDNNGVDAVTGQHAGLASGALVTINGEQFRIFYNGGTGNDVVLIRNASPLPIVYVDDDWAGTIPGTDPDGAGPATIFGIDAFETLHEAIAAVDPDGDVIVYAGTYDEPVQIAVAKNIDVIGEDRATTIVRPSADTGSGGESRGWFLVSDGVTLNVSGMTFDGNGRLIWQAFRHRGSGLFDDVAFHDIQFNAGGPSYQGTAIAAFGSSSDIDVTNSTFTEIGRVGVLYFGAGVTGTFQDNTYTGKGAGDFLDYALDISAGAQIDVIGNTITDNLGVASSDGSASAGILVSTFFGGGTTANIQNNFVTGNTTGVYVGFDGSDTSTATIFDNDLSGNVSHAIVSTAPHVDASGNWFGTNVAADVLAETFGPVDITPYLDSGTDTDGGTAGFQGDFSTLHATELGAQTGAGGRIQEAVDVAASLTVIVEDGTYPEDVLIGKDGFTLESRNGAATTIIDGQSVAYGGAVRVTNGRSGVTIGGPGTGLTINAAGTAGIYVGSNGDGFTIQDNVVTAATGQNSLLTEGGQSNHTIQGNTFLGDASQLVYVNGTTSVANGSTNVDFIGNTFGGSATGPLLGQEADDSDITSNLFTGVTSYAAIELFGDNAAISDNALTGGGAGIGLKISSLATGTVVDASVGANTISGFDVGVEVDNTDATVTGSDFSGGNTTADVLALASGGGDTLAVGPAGFSSGGTLNITSDGTVGTMTVLGLGGDDVFNVDPSLATVISIDGGSPSAPATPGDTFNFTTPGGEAASDNGSSIATTGGYQTVFYTEIETINIAGQIVITGSGEDDHVIVTATGEDSGTYQLITDATGVTPVAGPIVNFTGLAGLTFNGLGGDDVLTLTQPSGDFFNPLAGVTFNGGGQNGDGNVLGLPGVDGDTLQINPPGAGAVEADSITHRFDPASMPPDGDDGLITIADLTISDGTTTITYTGLEPVLDSLPAADRIFDFVAGAETITLSDDGDAGDGQSLIDSTLGESVTFANPSNSLTVQTGGGGGADAAHIEGLDSLFAADLTFTGDVDDTAVFQSATTDTAGGNLLVDTGGVTVGASVLTGGGAATLRADGDIAFTAAGSLDSELGSTAAVVLTADDDGNASGGIMLADGSMIDAWGGTLTLTARDNIAVSLLRSSATTTVTSTAGAITDADGGAGGDIHRDGSLVLVAATGIGGGAADPLETTVDNLEASGGSGGVAVANTGNLAIGGIGATVGVSATSGAVAVSVIGGLTVDEDVDAAGGNVTLTAGETGATTDHLSVTGPVTISSGTGNVLLEAGDDFQLAAGTTYSAAGTITVTSIDTGVDVASSLFQVEGDFDATLATFNGSTVDDSSNGDTFNITPDQDTGDVITPFQVNGNDPTVAPGDVLNLDIAGLTSPTLSILLGQGNGIWSFGNAGAVNYTSIEQVNRNPDTECYSLQLDMVAAGFDDAGTSDIDYVEIAVLAGSPQQLQIVVDGTEVFRGDLSSGGMPTLCEFLFVGSDDVDVLDFSQLGSAMDFSLTGLGSDSGFQGTSDLPTTIMSPPSAIGLGLTFDNVDGLHGTAGSDTLSMDAALRTHWDIGGDVSGAGLTASLSDAGVLIADDATLSEIGNDSTIGRPTGADPITPLGGEQDLAWASIEVLVGSATRDDRFDLRDGASITGTIDGRGHDADGNGDSIDFRDWTTAVTVELATGTATGINAGGAGGLLAGAGGDAGNSIENAFGGDGADAITGDAENNILGDGFGDDVVEGGLGDDVLRLEPGAAGGGDGSLDVVTDAGGVDTVDFRFARAGVTVDADLVGFDQTDPAAGVDEPEPQDVFAGGAGNLVSLVRLGDSGQTRVTPSPFENLVGSQFNDVLDLDPFEHGVLANPRHVDGNNPPGPSLDSGPADSIPPGDTWRFDASGNAVFDTGFSLSVAGRTAVTYVSIESLTVFNSAARIVDNDDDDFEETPHKAVGNFSGATHWERESGDGYGDDYLVNGDGDGSTRARWDFFGLTPGQYRVAVTYPEPAGQPFVNDLATDAPFQVFDDGRLLANIEVHQQTPADDFGTAGALWHDLGVFTIHGHTLSVELSDLADGFVMGDAVYVERVGNAPLGASGELSVLAGDDLLADAVGGIDLVTTVGQPLSQTLTVRNDGSGPLTVHDVQLDPAAANLTLTPSVSLPIVLAPGISFDFDILLDAATAAGHGDFPGQVRIFSDDFDENVVQPAGATGIPDPLDPTRDVDPFTLSVRGGVSNTTIIDNSDAGFSVFGVWDAGPTGFQGSEVSTPGDDSGDAATWTFTNLPDGWYRVSATWGGSTSSPAATNSPFSVSDMGGVLQSVTLDQTAMPNDLMDAGVAWEDLGPAVFLTGGTLVVELTDMAVNMSRRVLADAVRVERLFSDAATVPAFTTADPDIQVEAPADVADDTGQVDFGSTWNGLALTKTLTVRNVGGSSLTVEQPVSLPAGFTLVSFDGVAPPDGATAATIAAGNSIDLVVRMEAGLPGTLGGEISFGTNDPDEGVFNFDVTGTIHSSQLIDDEDPSPDFTSTAGFTLFTNNSQGYNGHIHFATADGTGDQTVWTFDGVTPGASYLVSTSWSPSGNRATAAQFSVSGVTSPATVDINQQETPDDRTANGTVFEDLGTFTADGSGSLVVTLSDTAVGGGLVIADVVRIEAISGPEIQIEQGASVVLGGQTVDFGGSEVGTPIDRTFTIRNVGVQPLALGDVELPNGFSLVGAFPNATSIPAGGSASFTVRFAAAAAGEFGGTLVIDSDDIDNARMPIVIIADAFLDSLYDVDDADAPPMFTSTGGFSPFGGQGRGGTVEAAASNAGPSTATWTFDGLTPGDTYRVSATWSPHPNRATNAGFTVAGGEGGAVLTSVNQQVDPADYAADGSLWQDLSGPYTVDTNGMLVVTLSNAGVNGYVIADSVLIELLPDQPEITVTDSGSTNVSDGGTFTFTSAAIGTPVTEMFTVANHGSADLTLDNASLVAALDQVPQFTLVSGFSSTTVAPGDTATFSLQMLADQLGTQAATIVFGNNDADEGLFEITLQGDVIVPSLTIDDGDYGAGYSEVGPSAPIAGVSGQGFMNDVRQLTPGLGNTSRYTFTGLTPMATYQVAATWTALGNRATDAPLTISGGLGGDVSFEINQQLVPVGFVDGGRPFEVIALIRTTGSTLVIEWGDDANGLVIADAVQLSEMPAAGPEIQVTGSPNVDTGDAFDLGSVAQNGTLNKTFTITNQGTSALDISSVMATGDFIVTGVSTPVSILPDGAPVTFTVNVVTATPGAKSGVVTIASTDVDENPFEINVSATVATPVTLSIIDNDGPVSGGTYTDSGNLQHWSNQGYAGDVREALGGGPTETATYTFTGLTPGSVYSVAATWTPFSNRSMAAPYAVSGVTMPGTVTKDQRLAPNDFVDAGTNWDVLGAYTATGSSLTVVLSGTASGNVIVDAVRLEHVTGPEIQVSQAGSPVTSGSSTVDFGQALVGSSLAKVFTIQNVGATTLDLGPTLSLPATGFTLGARTVNGSPSATLFDGATTVMLAPGQDATFELMVDTSAPAALGGTVSFGNNDANEAPFSFDVAAQVLGKLIIDNSQSGFAATPGFSVFGGQGLNGTVHAEFSPNGGDTATWTFANLPSGSMFRVSATWFQFSNRATNASFSISSTSGGGSAGPVPVNQKLPPSNVASTGIGAPIFDSGVWFSDLNTAYLHTGGDLVVTLSDTAANGWIIADAIRVAAPGMLHAADHAHDAAAPNGLTAAPPHALRTQDVTPVLAQAVEYWAGIDPSSVGRLDNVQVFIQDLPSSILGLGSFASPTIWLDTDGAGHGWRLEPAADGLAGEPGRIDLLTTVAHELGHVLGYPDLDASTHQGHVMAATLPSGQHRVTLLDTTSGRSAGELRRAAKPDLLGSDLARSDLVRVGRAGAPGRAASDLFFASVGDNRQTSLNDAFDSEDDIASRAESRAETGLSLDETRATNRRSSAADDVFAAWEEEDAELTSTVELDVNIDEPDA